MPKGLDLHTGQLVQGQSGMQYRIMAVNQDRIIVTAEISSLYDGALSAMLVFTNEAALKLTVIHSETPAV